MYFVGFLFHGLCRHQTLPSACANPSRRNLTTVLNLAAGIAVESPKCDGFGVAGLVADSPTRASDLSFSRKPASEGAAQTAD